MIVCGEAASNLARLFIDRWKWATGVSIGAARSRSVDLWPKCVTPALENIEVGISRTYPSYKERQEVREVESLYREAIAAAKECIYIENQYLTSYEISGALKTSLSRERGPDVIVILPEKSSGWLEQSTMDALRSRRIKDLKAADRHHRFQVYYPCLDDGKTPLYVHSKLMIVDDRLLSIGSANLSNRSMGLDSECNLSVEAKGDKRVRKAIISLRNRLLAEHLGSSADRVSESLADHGSVIDLIESSRSAGRCLKPLPYEKSLPIDGAAVAGNPQLLDPEAPIEFDRMMDRLVQFDTGQNRMQRTVLITGGALMFLLILAVAWHWTPLSEWVDTEGLESATAQIRSHPMFLPGTMAVYVAGGFFMIPVILPVGLTAMVLGPFWGAVYAWLGCLLGAVLNFFTGYALGKQTIRKVAGRHLNPLSRRMLKPGLMGMIMLRNVPMVPFGMVNLVAGVSRMKVKDYILGTALGILPGIVVVSLLADRLLHVIRRPGWMDGLIVVALVSALIVGYWWMTKRLTKSGEEK
jgi:uncharacterized membrane protein YdjX (TVP38/TMEM64 family)